MSDFSHELQVTCAAPALANAALLVAEGCANKYIEAINVLYLANGLPCPNLMPLLSMKSPSNVIREADVSHLSEANTHALYSPTIILPSIHISDTSHENAEWFTYNMLESSTEAGENKNPSPFPTIISIHESNIADSNQESTPFNTIASTTETNHVDDWAPLSALASTPRNSFIPNELVSKENWLPLSRLGAFDSTPMLNKIGINNPSPGAYYYLDLMSRHKKLLFDISVDSIPDTLLDTVIQQAETLSSPKCDINKSDNYNFDNDIQCLVTNLSLESPTKNSYQHSIRSSSISDALGQISRQQNCSSPNIRSSESSSINERSRHLKCKSGINQKSIIAQSDCMPSRVMYHKNKKHNTMNNRKSNGNGSNHTLKRWRN